MAEERVAVELRPLADQERYPALDSIRGVALFGVLMVNLLTGFRVSLMDYIVRFHTDDGWANRVMDVLVAGAIEFKAFALFSLLFGLGVAVQAERAAGRGVWPARFLVRRFGALLLLGMAHIALVWNGDILTLYAVCGLLMIPFLSLSARGLLLAGTLVVVAAFTVPLPVRWPSQDEMRGQAIQATTVYGTGGYWEILRFRWEETVRFIFPLLASSLPKTLGTMLLGLAVWRFGLVQNPSRHRRALVAIAVAGGLIGATLTAVQVYAHATRAETVLPGLLVDLGSSLPLAFAYGAMMLLWMGDGTLVKSLAAAGRMAFSNYVAQSVVFGMLFYGYGFGLFGRLGSAVTAGLGMLVYAAQVCASQWWLHRFRFGPLEWLWRTITYGRAQPMRRRRVA